MFALKQTMNLKHDFQDTCEAFNCCLIHYDQKEAKTNQDDFIPNKASMPHITRQWKYKNN